MKLSLILIPKSFITLGSLNNSFKGLITENQIKYPIGGLCLLSIERQELKL